MDELRRWWPLAAGVLLGVVVGIAVSLLVSGTRRAEASVLISSPAGTGAVRPQLPNLRELATSAVVAGNVRSTLRLPESTEKLRDRLRATVRPQAEVIAISATDSKAEHARQLAQEAAVVFGQLVDARFGSGKPELHAAVLDSAHVLGGPERHVLRDGAIGALVGLLLGSAGMFVLAGRKREARTAWAGMGDDHELRKRESALEQRVKGVTGRERKLASRAGELAAREKKLEQREKQVEAGQRELSARSGEVASTRRELAERASRVAARERELEARAAEPPPPPPAPPEPEPQPEPVATLDAPRLVRVGSWNVDDLQRTVDAQAGVTSEQAEEWRTYLFFLREHASSDGALPPQFDGLVEDVFGELF